LHYAAQAGVAKSYGGYWADGHYCGFARLIGDGAKDRTAFALIPIEEIANGGRAEK
jgi:hypothetical protein